MNTQIKMNCDFTVLDLFKKFNYESQSFKWITNNIPHTLVYALYKTKYEEIKAFSASPYSSNYIRLSTELYNYDVELTHFVDEELGMIDYESVYDIPPHVLCRRVVITRKEHLPNDVPTRIVWDDCWYLSDDDDFPTDDVEPEDMVSTKVLYLLADIFDDLTDVFETLGLNQYDACRQYQTLNENKVEMIKTAYFLDAVINEIDMNNVIKINYEAHYDLKYKINLGHEDEVTKRIEAKGREIQNEVSNFSSDDIEGPIF